MIMKNRALLLATTIIFSIGLVISAVPLDIDGETLENDGKTIDFGQFLTELSKNRTEVENGKYNYAYDGKGITVQWSPTSACTYGNQTHECLITDSPYKESDGNDPQRIENTINAQYQILSDGINVSISYVNFIFIPADFTICKNSGWKGSTTAAETPNAELQFLNTGDVIITGCTFDKVKVSSFNSATMTDIQSCSFTDVFDSYALFGLYSPTIIVNGCSFSDSNGGIYIAGHGAAKKSITITDNTFSDMGGNCSAGKEDSRGLIQFSSADDYRVATITIVGNSSDNDASVIRQKNSTINENNLDMNAIVNDNDFKGGLFVQDDKVYLDVIGGDDSNNGSAGHPVKTMSKAMTLSHLGGTIIIEGDIKDIDSIDRSVMLVGNGKITGSVTLPENVGYLMFSGFTIPELSLVKGNDLTGLNLVFRGCTFENDSRLVIECINSLSADECTFKEAPESKVVFGGEWGSVVSNSPTAEIELSGSNSSIKITSDDGTAMSVSVSIIEMPVATVQDASSVFDITISTQTGYSAEITIPISIPNGFTAKVVSYDNSGNVVEEHPVINIGTASITFTTNHNTVFAVFLSESPVDDSSIVEDEDYPFFPWNGNNQGTVTTPADDTSDDKTKIIAAAAAIVVIMLAAVALMVNRNN